MKTLNAGPKKTTTVPFSVEKREISDKEQGKNVLEFPKNKRNAMKEKTLKRYNTQTIAFSDEEKDALEVLSIWSGIKPASLARSLFYRGIESFLQDKKLQSGRDENDIHADVDKLISADKEMKACRAIIENRKSRAHSARKTG